MSDEWAKAADDAMSEDQEDATRVRLADLESQLMDSEQLSKMPPPEPLIDGYLFKDNLVWVAGKPGHAKTFAAWEMAACIGTGKPWFGHAVTQGKVLYLIAEGVPGFAQRVATWEAYNGLSTQDSVTFLPVPIQFINSIDVAAFGLLMDKHRYDVVFFDTQARVTVGMKENDSTDMGIFVDKLGMLRRLYGACLVLVHHEPRNGEHLRGSIAMDGAADSIFRTFKEGNQVTFETSKQKDIDEPDSFDLQLFATHTSAVLTPLQAGEEALTQIQMRILMELDDNPSEWVSKTELKSTCALADNTFYSNLNKLIKKGYIDQVSHGRTKQLRYIPEDER